VIRGKFHIGIVFGDGALGCWVRARRIAKRLGGWAEVQLRPFGGEYRNLQFRSWYDDIYSWMQENAFDLLIDDQALLGIMVAKSSKCPVISIIQHHPIWTHTYQEAMAILQFADRVVIPMWDWIGDDGLSSLSDLKENIIWVGPIFDEESYGEQVAIEEKTLLVTEGSAKYDRTLFTIAKQAARFLPEWIIKLNEPSELQDSSVKLPNNCTLIPITDHFSCVLARSQAVTCAGGITMLEAIYYHKLPIVLPVPFQKEQAWTVERLATLRLAKIITAGIAARSFANLVETSIQERPSPQFPLTSGLDGLETLVRELLSC
jgi:hypothetical protein